VSLSVVVPAFNERDRLPIMLEETVDFLEERAKSEKNFAYEIVLVDDGSKDDTAELARQWAASKAANVPLRVLELAENRGKGGAVRAGAMRSRGERILFADADGATKFADLAKLEAAMDACGAQVVCGSRAHLENEAIATRSLFRTILMVGFHACVRLFGTSAVRDTQCGFKLLTRKASRAIFPSLHIERWAFDVELLKIADLLDLPVAEVAVRWTEVEGSKLSPALAAIQMFRDLFLLWLRYKVGAWRIRVKSE